MENDGEKNYLTLNPGDENDLSHIGQSSLRLLSEVHRNTGGSRTVALMRHSARHYGQAENDLDNPLSDEGRGLSLNFGENLPRWNRFALTSSPSGRCIETAELIRDGHNHPTAGDVSIIDDLAVFYVKDMRKVGGMNKYYGAEGTLVRWFAGDVDESWMDSPVYSANRLLRRVRALFDEGASDQLTLCVSHDWNLYLIARMALGIDYSEQVKAEYLDCIVFYERDGEMRVADKTGFDASLSLGV